jgi:hypothetical protein
MPSILQVSLFFFPFLVAPQSSSFLSPWPVRVSAVMRARRLCSSCICSSSIWHLWCASCVLIVFRCCRLLLHVASSLCWCPSIWTAPFPSTFAIVQSSSSSCFLMSRVSSCLSITADATRPKLSPRNFPTTVANTVSFFHTWIKNPVNFLLHFVLGVVGLSFGCSDAILIH